MIIKVFIIEKFIRLLGGMLTFILIARYVNTEQLGIISVGASIFAICQLFLQLESKPYLIGDINNNGDFKKLAAVFQISFILSFSLIVMTIIFALFWDLHVVLQITLIGSALVSTLSITKWINEGQEKFKTIIFIDIFTNLISVTLKVFIVYFKLEWEFIAVIIIVDFMINGLINLILIEANYRRKLISHIRNFEIAIVKQLIKDLLPLIIAGGAVVLYSRLDMIMLASMCGTHCAGEYVLALRFAELLIIPTAMIVTFSAPKYLNPNTKYSQFQSKYIHIINFSSLLSLVSVFFILPVMLFLYKIGSVVTPPYTSILYLILGFAFVIASIGMISSIYINKIEKRNYLAERCIMGLVLNIICNFLFIPYFSSFGAAFATLFSQLVAVFIYDLFKADLRCHLRIKLKSLVQNPISIPNVIRLGLAELLDLRSNNTGSV